METVALSVLLLPFLSALVTLLFLRKQGNIASLLSVATAGGILALSLFLIFAGQGEIFSWCVTWIQLSGWELKFGFLIDAPARHLLFVFHLIELLLKG